MSFYDYSQREVINLDEYEDIEYIIEEEVDESYPENIVECVECDDSEQFILPHEEEYLVRVSPELETLPTENEKENPTSPRTTISKRENKSRRKCISKGNKIVPARTVKPPCSGCLFNCGNIFSADERKSIFQSFWNSTEEHRNCFYKKFVQRQDIKRRSKHIEKTIKQFSFKYYFEKNKSLHRVCRIFFLHTLCVDQKKIYYYFKHLQNESICSPFKRAKTKNNKTLPTKIGDTNCETWETNTDSTSTKNNIISNKMLKDPCKGCLLNCVNVFTVDERKNIFKSFSRLNDEERNNFYNTFVKRDQYDKKSGRTIKKFSFKYFLKQNRTLRRVCRNFFLNTLNVDSSNIYSSFNQFKNKTCISPPQRIKGKTAKSLSTEKTKKGFSVTSLKNESISSAPQTRNVKTGKSLSPPEKDCNWKLIKNKSINSRPLIRMGKTSKYFSTGKANKCSRLNKLKNESISSPLHKKKENILKSLPTEKVNKDCSFNKLKNKNISSPAQNKNGTTLPKEKVNKGAKTKTKTSTGTESKIIGGRTLKPTCKGCPFECAKEFTEDERMDIFKMFWSLTDNEKNCFYNTFVTRENVKRRKKDSVTKIKQFTFRYYFEKDQCLYRVCRIFFLHTLCIDQKRIYYSFKHLMNKDTGAPLPRTKGKNVKRVTPPNKMSEVREHISSFTPISLHCCQKKPDKTYIDATLNITKMHNLYVLEYENPVSLSIYRKIFKNEFNIGFFKSKYSHCHICDLYQNKENSIPPEEKHMFDEHQLEKIALEEDLDDDLNNLDLSKCVICYDLQSGFSLPKGKDSLFYYKKRLSVYNLIATIIIPDVKTFSYCALWTEAYSDHSGNDIASALIKILNALVEEYPRLSTLVLWSDSCVPQNKINITALKMFMNSSNINTIIQKVSEPGHSIIEEIDSVHNAIETYLKNDDIYSPNHLISLLKNMPSKKMPLNILEMAPTDFHLYSAVASKLEFSNVPFSEIKVMTYEKADRFHIRFKRSARESVFQNECIIRSVSNQYFQALHNVFEQKLRVSPRTAIDNDKRKNIKDLLKFIPEDDKIYFQDLLKI